MKIDMTDWKEFEVQELFNVVYGVNLELVNCIETDKDDPEAVALGVRTKSWTKQRPQGGNRYIVHIRKESPRPAII